MKPLRTKQNSVIVLNFVADAFKEFQKQYLLEIKFGNLVEDDPFLSEIEAVKGYAPIRDRYRTLQREVYDSFTQHFKDSYIIDDVMDMDDFLREMTYYLLRISGSIYKKRVYAKSSPRSYGKWSVY